MNPLKLILLLGMFASSASAVLIVNEISGDANSLHAEFTVDWVNGTTQTALGTWDGGSWEFLSLNGPLYGNNETITQFFLRNIWSDGWNPGPAWKLFAISGQWAVLNREFGVDNINLDDPITFDYANTGLQYHLDASLFGDLETHVLGGSAHLVFDLQRSVPSLSNEDFRRAVDVQAVPETGSTFLLFCIAIGLLAKARCIRKL